jgi:hypothetical protein
MHDIKNFIDNKYCYYNKIDPKSYQYKGVQNAFIVGTAIDLGIKNHYLNRDKYNNKSFKNLDKVNQTIVFALVEAYKEVYAEEFFHNHQTPIWKIPTKKDVVYCSPDLVADSFFENKRHVIEIKSTAADTQETLDFQTMCYCWASYRWDFKVPAGVIKRTIYKPRIRQKQNESVSDFQKRLIFHIGDEPDKFFASNFREVNKDMIIEFEKYLFCILKEMKNRNKYHYYKPTNEYWGL